MRQIKRILALAAIGLAGTALGQEKGFYGKNTFIEVGAQGQFPVLQNILNDKGYVEKNGTLQKSYDLKDFGFRASLGTIVSENVALALEYNHRMYQVNGLRGGELNRQYIDSAGTLRTDYITPEVAFIGIQDRMIMPRIIFSTNSGRVPAGLTHEFGIGYSLISVYGSDFMVNYAGTNGITAESIMKNLIDPEFDELRGLTYMYGVRMNYPVSKNFLVNIGFRYSYSSLLNKKGFRDKELSEAWLSGREMWSRVNQHRQFGIINFSVGGVLCF